MARNYIQNISEKISVTLCAPEQPAEHVVQLAFGTPEIERFYRAEDLSAADRLRAALDRAPRAECDWRVSRALAARLRAGAGCHADAPVALSHSHGYALAALAPEGFAPGVDLELCRPRDVDALASWVCTAEERVWLDGPVCASDRLTRFYVLWTLKEALLKAGGLDFPADMTQIGLRPGATVSAMRLRAPPGAWEAVVCILAGGWIAALVWRLPDGLELAKNPLRRLRWLAPEPALQVLGAWTEDGQSGCLRDSAARSCPSSQAR